MADLKAILHDVAASIVDHPDDVTVAIEEDENTINLTLSVANDDMGMVIGKHGRIAKAIRTVVKAAAAGTEKKVVVDIVE